MSPLAALALATPIFGFSLTPPTAAPLAPMPASVIASPIFAQLDEVGAATSDDASTDAETDDARIEDAPADEANAEDVAIPESTAAQQAPEPPERSAASDATDLRAVAEQLRQRQEIATVHRAFGIATWASMLVTEVLGFIQYYNLYGFFGSREDTPCVRGDAVFGQDQCWGTPWPHLVAAMTTTALYATTFVLSFVMPDPLGADQGNSELASDLRMHETLRWVHLGGMIAQVLLGFAVGQNWFGLDRANDFGAMQAIATVHQVIGLGTLGVLTAAGAIMLF